MHLRDGCDDGCDDGGIASPLMIDILNVSNSKYTKTKQIILIINIYIVLYYYHYHC